jgi:hypothetical protein
VKCNWMKADFETVDLWALPSWTQYSQSQFSCTSLLHNCLLFPACIYILFRSPNPDERTLNDVKKDLKEDGVDFDQLVKWETNHCQDIKFP